MLGTCRSLLRDEITVAHVKPRTCEVAKIYKGHEIAAHTLTHARLTQLSDEEIINQVEQDRIALSEIAGYNVVGFAYPGAGITSNPHVAEVIEKSTGIKYCRGDISTLSTEIKGNLFEYMPTVCCPMQFDELDKLTDEFLADESENPLLLYIWGHSFEFDFTDTWERFDEYCKFISCRDDIFYGTNSEVLL